MPFYRPEKLEQCNDELAPGSLLVKDSHHFYFLALRGA
jgi:hypothetical protein